jgi:hypothetical protein
MEEKDFIANCIRVGFTPQQAAFLWNHTAQKPHSHMAEDIVVDPEDGETLDQFVDAVSEALAELEGDEGEEDETDAEV